MSDNNGPYIAPAPVTYDEADFYDLGSSVYDNPVIPQPVENLSSSPAKPLNYSDRAFPTTLSVSVSATDEIFRVKSTLGYPKAPFQISVDSSVTAINPAQEICLVTFYDTVSFTVVRNYDGNGAFPHSVNALVNHSVVASDYSVLNHHCYINTPAQDPANKGVDWHPQYLDQFRHSELPHVLGVTLGTGPTGSVSLPGSPMVVGASLNPAASDHVHQRETYQQLLAGVFESGMQALINTQRTDDFSWLYTSVQSVDHKFNGLKFNGSFSNNNFAPIGQQPNFIFNQQLSSYTQPHVGGVVYQNHPIPVDPAVSFYLQ